MAASNDIRLTISLKDLASGALKGVQGNLDRLQGKISSITGPIFNLKNALASLGVGLALKEVIGTFADFDDTMRQVGAVANATEAELSAMTATAEHLGATTRFSASEAAEGMKMLAMAGFESGQAMEALPGVLDLAAAGAVDLGTAADIASNMLTAYNMSAEELPRINDVMVQAFTTSNSTLGELGEAFKYVAPIAAGVGVELEELVAPMAKLHDAGIKGSMAGTALRGAIDALLNPTAQEAALMGELSERIGGAGLQIQDSSGKFVGFASVIEQLEGAGLTAGEALRLFGQRAGPAMQALVTQGSDALRDYEGTLYDAGGRARQVADDMEAGMGGAIRSLKSAWEGLKLALGGGLEGAVTDSIRFFTERIRVAIDAVQRLRADGTLDEWAGKISEAFRTIVSYAESMARAFFGVLDGAMKPLVQGFISWAPEILAVATGLLAFQKGLGAASLAMGALNTAMGMGQWVAYLKHVQTASTYTNLLTVATASLGNALTVALGAVGAFFAGWQIGKLIDASNFFGLMPITIGESVQVGFGMLDEFLTRAKIKFLEFRKVWAEFRGKGEAVAAIEEAIAAEERHILTIHETVAGIGEKENRTRQAGKAAVDAAGEVADAEQKSHVERLSNAASAEEQIRAFQRDSVDQYLSTLKEQTEAAKSELARRNTEIEIAENLGVMSRNEANAAKLEADSRYFTETIRKAIDAERQAAQAYGIGSDKYKQAQEAKKAALDDWLQKEKSASEQVMALAEQVADSQKSSEEKIRELRRKNMSEYDAYQDRVKEIQEKLSEAQKLAATDTEGSIALFREAMNAASGVSTEVKEGERVLVSQQKAVSTAIGLVEQAQSGIESAAAKQTSAIESGMEATRRSAEEAKAGLSEVGAEMDAVSENVIEIQADGEAAIQEIDRVHERLSALTDAEIKIAIDTAMAERSIEALSGKVDALHAKAARAIKSVVEFKGKASPEAGLTETLDQVSTAVSGFQELAAHPVTSVSEFQADFGEGPTGFSQGLDQTSARFAQFADEQQVHFTGIADVMGKSTGAISEMLDRTRVSLEDSFGSVRAGLTETVEAVGNGWGGMTEEMIGGMIHAANTTIAEAEAMGSDFGGQIDGMKADVKTLEEELAKKKELNLDAEAADKAILDLDAAVDATKEKIADPAKMDIDISPAKQALRELAQEAYKNAVASKKIAIELAGLQKDAGYGFGDIMRQQYRLHNQNFQKYEKDWRDFSAQANVKFTGSGSPTRPLSEKIAEMSGKMKDFSSDLGDNVVQADFSPIRKGLDDVMKDTAGGFHRPTAIPAQPPPFDAGPATPAGMDLRDMGKLDLSIGGKGGTVFGKQEVLRWVKDGMAEEQRRGQA